MHKFMIAAVVASDGLQAHASSSQLTVCHRVPRTSDSAHIELYWNFIGYRRNRYRASPSSQTAFSLLPFLHASEFTF
jgi:hypothetical protein